MATATEEKRKEWVRQELVRIGGERARSLGWTDCYTFTKALGERAVEEHAAHAPTSIVRPSIIESALESLHPGWIEGFKMAEPRSSPTDAGSCRSSRRRRLHRDIVPVDHVVAAIVAVAAPPGRRGRRTSTCPPASGTH